MKGGGSGIPLALTAFAVLVLVGVVAVASSGSTPTGTADGRPPADILLDTLFSLTLIALIPAAALLVYALLQRKEIAQEIASRRYPRMSMLAFVIFVAAFTAAVYVVRERGGFWNWGDMGEVVEIGPDGAITVRDASANDENAYQAEFAWIPVLVVLALATAGVAAFVLASRRRRIESRELAVAEELADVLDETLDDLRAEPDARRAVIAAFARLERALAAAGLPRSSPETAQEYVARVLEQLEVDPRPIRSLTDLFTHARFSHHEVTEAMKLDAVDALERIRDELRAAAHRAEETMTRLEGTAATE